MTLVTISLNTLKQLRRDKFFLPSLVMSVFLMQLAIVVAYWGIFSFEKVKFELAFFFIQMCGAIVAIFWGVKSLNDAKTDGSLEFQLSSPVSRSTWVIGKFLGLASALVLLGIIMTGFFQVLLILDGSQRLETLHITIMAYSVLGWVVLAALATLLSCVSGFATALFSSLALWLAGLTGSSVARTLPSGTDDITRGIIETFVRFWNLHYFNFSSAVAEKTLPSHEHLLQSASYGALTIAALISVAAVAFSRRDLIGD